MNKDYIGYEYRNKVVKKKYESIYMDSYENYGWLIDERAASIRKVDHITLKLKRDRKITNKAELSRLQKQFESHVQEIDTLETSKYIVASTVAYIIGIIGCAFMAGGVFAITASTPNVPLCAFFGIIGFIGWVLPYLCYRTILQRKAEKIDPLINNKYEDIYQVNRRAHALL
ncbi:MAG: hypothetical protein ACK5LC_09460 [Coprobacillaceae bacterium]